MSVTVSSTYRLQLRPDALTFADARAITEYLQLLGVSHLYLSPILTPMRGSHHGYDIADPTNVNPGLGGPGGLRALSDEARTRGLRLIVDIVPNHMGIADPQQNHWWWDVLELGQASEYAEYFDIDWSPDNGADGKLALPVLSGDMDLSALGIDRGGMKSALTLGDMRFPIAPGTDRGLPVHVHDRQHYRLVDWRAGIVSYRRFFAVNSLAGLRQENPAVFEATHAELAAWCKHDLIDGVRVDHPDGLSDPTAYLSQLRELIGPDRLLLAEKILGENEILDPTLPVDGTTGYEALGQIGGVLLDPRGEAALSDVSQRFTGISGDARWLDQATVKAKRTVAQTQLAPEIRRLVAAIARDAGPVAVGISPADLTAATVETLASMPVYRADYPSLAGVIPRVLGRVEYRYPNLARPLSALVAALGTRGEAATRFHQVGGAMMAKSVEDCVFYRCARLVSLQEVGGDPGRFGWSVNELHMAHTQRARHWPRTMTTLSTHDTKRGEDVRSRIGVLSQFADHWARHLVVWDKMTPAPDGDAALFLLQNMFGVWPHDGSPAGAVPGLRGRLHAYTEKALREAGLRTNWDAPNVDYEKAVHAWVDAVIDGPVGNSLGQLVAELAPHAWSDSLAQKLIQLCGPGSPDIYQGTELWEDSLVDPDNRRVVDFAARARLLRALVSPPAVDGSGAAKIWVVAHSLWLRRERADCFIGGTYLPVFATGPGADHLVAFARGTTTTRPEVIAAATRHSVTLAETGWGPTFLDLPDGTWTDRLTARDHTGRVALADLFSHLPVALLVRT